MRTTSINDVTTVLSQGISNGGKSVGMTSQISFQNVWNEQTAARNASSKGTDKEISETPKKNPGEDVVKGNENVRKPVKNADRPRKRDGDLTEEQLEEAKEVLGAAAEEMLKQVADTFGMTVEELTQRLEAFGMSTMDLLNPEQLSSLLLELAGTQDTMELLTNEGLYTDYSQIMGQQKELLAEVGQDLQISEEQLEQMLTRLGDGQEKLMEPASGAEELPVDDTSDHPMVEISVDTAENIEETEHSQKDDALDVSTHVTLQENNAGTKVQESDAGAKTGGNHEQHSEKGSEQTGNLLLQNLKLEGMQPEANAAQTGTVWDADTQDIMRQIMDYMKIQVKPDVSDMEMQLHPESLGTLQIHVSSKGGVVTANFITQNETVKAALESQMVQLKENFAEQGVKVEAIEVTVQTHQFDRNLDQGQGSRQEETTRKNRTRRIQLNGLTGLEETEELSQEDSLVAEIMTANGNTVDYTA